MNSMNWDLIITGLGSALAAILASFLVFKGNERKQHSSEFQELMDRYKLMVDKLEAKVDSLSAEMEEVRKEKVEQNLLILNLKNQLLIFESSHVDIPLPMWMKDVNGKMIFVNSFYEDQLLIPRGYNTRDYIGFTDHAVWPKETADQYSTNDKRVLKTKRSHRTIESFEESDGVLLFMDVLKYPRMLNRNVIGVSGIILRTSYNKIDLNIDLKIN